VAATAPAERIESIDILRGLALYGVLVVNLVGSFRTSFLQYIVLREPGLDAADRIAELLIRVLLEGKAVTLFSFLFGAGLAIQYERLARRHPAPEALLRRRMLVLLGFGLAHLLLLWNGDILAQYALLGLVAIALLGAGEERLHQWIGTLLAIGIFLPVLASAATVWDTAAVRDEAERALVAYATGSFAQVRAYSLGEIVRYIAIPASLSPQTLAVFLVGLLAWRAGLLRDPGAHAPRLRRLTWIGLVGGGSLTLFNQVEPQGLALAVLPLTLTFGPLLLAMGYGAGLLLVLRSEALRARLAPIAALGRMAFTNYIAQSIVFGFVFFGYGLGLFGKVGVADAWLLGTGFYALQAAASRWWLARFRFGPLEWAWRSLTYGERQPMSR